MRSKTIALILAACLLGACATGRPDARAKFYQDELDNRKLGRFSEQEKRNIFKNTGSYNVFYLLKQESRRSNGILSRLT